MLQFLGTVASAIGTGFVSAVFPAVNAEVATGVGAAVASLPFGVAWVAGIAVGQTIGKIVVYEAARAGKAVHARRRAKKAATSDAAPAVMPDIPPSATSDTPPPATSDVATQSRWARLRAWLGRTSQKLLALMDNRWRADAVLLLSASAGIPPLLATAAFAGVVKVRRVDFVVCVLVGRLARFFVVAAPFLALT
jgi:membrane protein YqaA with SNARE-associated domain